jgi:hypothetical protein
MFITKSADIRFPGSVMVKKNRVSHLMAHPGKVTGNRESWNFAPAFLYYRLIFVGR